TLKAGRTSATSLVSLEDLLQLRFQYPQSGSNLCHRRTLPAPSIKWPLSVPSKRVEPLPHCDNPACTHHNCALSVPSKLVEPLPPDNNARALYQAPSFTTLKPGRTPPTLRQSRLYPSQLRPFSTLKAGRTSATLLRKHAVLIREPFSTLKAGR